MNKTNLTVILLLICFSTREFLFHEEGIKLLNIKIIHSQTTNIY